MKKKQIITGIIVLFSAALLSGYLLSQVFGMTKPRIDEQKRLQEERLNKEIFPEGADFVETQEQDISFTAVFDSGKNLIGRIFRITTSGYGGPIVVKIGFDSELRLKAVRILEHTETPGLGSKITESSFLEQFRGKSGSELYLKKYHKDGTLDAVTGATISSKAVSDGILKIQEKLMASAPENTEGSVQNK